MNSLKNPFAILLLFTLILSFSSKAQEVVYFCGKSGANSFQVWKKDITTGGSLALTNNLAYNYWWVEPSPDNTMLVMMRSPIGPGINDQFDYDSCQMVVSDVNGSNLSVIVDYNQYGWTAFGNPHWHPSGNRIIMLAQPTNEFFIFTIDPDGSNPQQISNQFSLDPHWSTNGNKIVFIGINSTPTFPPSFDDFEVFTADYNYTANSLTSILQLTNDTLRDHDPCFSPDDSKIAFSSGSQNLSFANIVQIDVNGSNRMDLINDNTTNGGPVNWGSNNKIYYHNVNLFVTNFKAREYDVSTATVSDIAPASSAPSISPYYKNAGLVSTSQLVQDPIEFSVYPNPIIDEELTLELKSLQGKCELKILDLKGKIILETEITNLTTNLDVKNLSKGAYILHLKIDGQVINRKIVKDL